MSAETVPISAKAKDAIRFVPGVISAIFAVLNFLRSLFEWQLPWRPTFGWVISVIFFGIFAVAVARSQSLRHRIGKSSIHWMFLLGMLALLLIVITVYSFLSETAAADVAAKDTQIAGLVPIGSTRDAQIAVIQTESAHKGSEIMRAKATQTAQATNLEGTISARSGEAMVAKAALTEQAISLERARGTIEAQALAVDGAKATIEAQGTALAVVQSGGSKAGGAAQPCRYDALISELASVPAGVPEVTGGQRILRIWSIENSGTCTWGGETAWVFVSDTPGLMPELSRWPMSSVLPGQDRVVDELLVAPNAPGEYRGHWQMVNETGTAFGAPIPIRITVRAESFFGTPVPNCRPAALYVSDGSYSDRSERPTISTGKRFHKAWIMTNPRWGCPWSEDYKLVQVLGDDFGITQQPVLKTLPGEPAYLIVQMVAPILPGVYKSSWRMEDPSGNRFGDEVWMEIEVK